MDLIAEGSRGEEKGIRGEEGRETANSPDDLRDAATKFASSFALWKPHQAFHGREIVFDSQTNSDAAYILFS